MNQSYLTEDAKRQGLISEIVRRLSWSEDKIRDLLSRRTIRTEVDLLGSHGLNGTIGAGLSSSLVPWVPGLAAAGSSIPIPRTGILRNCYFRMWTAQPASGSLVVTVMVGNPAVATSIVITVPPGGIGTFSDTVDSAVINANDYMYWRIVNNAAANSGQIGGTTIGLEFEI